MKQQKAEQGAQAAGQASSPGSETERFRAVVDPRHNEAVTAESGVPLHLRDHELRRQRRSLEEFS
jgi:type V secretory pathway adhesin AidA